MADGRTEIPAIAPVMASVSILARPWRTGAPVLGDWLYIDAEVSILARPWRTGAPVKGRTVTAGALFQSSPVHGGRAHMAYPSLVEIPHGFNPRPSMADGRTPLAHGADNKAGVSILARPWRTGAQRLARASRFRHKFQSSPVHGGRAHGRSLPSMLFPVGFNPRPSMADGRTHAWLSNQSHACVSILARPWRTGAHMLGYQISRMHAFQSSPVHGGRAHLLVDFAIV